jgi:hypothetical protein
VLLVEKGVLNESNGSVNNALPGVQGKALKNGHNESDGAQDEEMTTKDDEEPGG